MSNSPELGAGMSHPDGPLTQSLTEPDPSLIGHGQGPAMQLDQATALERESPLPQVAPGGNIHDLYEIPASHRDRHLGLMALGQRRESWY